MLSSVEQAFVGRDEKRAPLKTSAWKAIGVRARGQGATFPHNTHYSENRSWDRTKKTKRKSKQREMKPGLSFPKYGHAESRCVGSINCYQLVISLVNERC